MDQLYPEVGLAALEVLRRAGTPAVVLDEPVCCGQPLLSAGAVQLAAPFARHLARAAAGFDHLVCPSASCVATVRHGWPAASAATDAEHGDTPPVRELCEFLVDVLGVESLTGRFPHRVTVHESCHGLRELRVGGASERPGEPPSQVRALLGRLEGIELMDLSRTDECCGFGGIFSIREEAVSCLIGLDRLDDHERARAQVVTSTDASCLAHLAGLARRRGSGLRFMHVAEILAGREPPA